MPAPAVSLGAQVMCSFGVAPTPLVVTPEARVLVGGKPMAAMTDQVPMKNVMPFGMCTSLANPTVAAATSAALGALTPMPCIPVIPAPWAPPAPTVLVGGKPAINITAKCFCAYGGVIQIFPPGVPNVTV